MLCMLTRYRSKLVFSSRALITAGSVTATCLLTNGCSYSKNQFHMRKQDWRDQKFGLIAAIPKLDAISTESPFFLLVQEEVKKRIRSQGGFLLKFSACDIGFNGAENNFGNAYISSILWLFTDGVVQYLDVYRRDISTPRPLTHHVTTHPEISHNWLSSNTIKWPQGLATISDQETEDRFMQC